MSYLKSKQSSYPAPDALVAQRNSRLWTAHAQRLAGTERDHALSMAAQWTATFQMLMATAPGDRRVPLRRGDRDENRAEFIYYLVLGLALLALAIYIAYNALT
ncbi:hypothetical protein B7435_17100 [Mycolicibacterium peregrinum]|uniref:hypothetical protein n=1 Tax=Mycolicibacterium TaxID=1866885 RepID=UPI000B4ACB14|nr:MULTISPECIES: hypothetical protein [Mycolicibacterium]MCV7003633.1 hypothetical protein [Mycolicibacterium alvei]OWM01277.1 hypothetical protein B7435_17100 [Mycolicibacterium peregrinum]